ncbi:MAG: hypothetical protein K6T83_03280 [Alicyclobacillus sp.]|nr:hypothetical protein [Alicyclobacillus sp.]
MTIDAEKMGNLTAQVSGISQRLDDHIANVKDGFAEVKENIAELKNDVHRDNDELKQQFAAFAALTERQHNKFLETMKDVLSNYATNEKVDLVKAAQDKQFAEHERRIATAEVTILEHDRKIQRWVGGLALFVILMGVVEALASHFNW